MTPETLAHRIASETGAMKTKDGKVMCPVCHGRDLIATSATPGDGRRKWRCKGCNYDWTNGKRKGEGYKSGWSK